MAILAGEIVTGGRLGLLQPTPYYAIGTGSVAASQTNADVPSAVVTPTTVNANATYTAICTWDFSRSGASTALTVGRLSVDGVAQNPLSAYAAEVTSDRSTITQTYQGTLASAGAHTLKLIVTTQANQTVQGVNSSIQVTIYEVV